MRSATALLVLLLAVIAPWPAVAQSDPPAVNDAQAWLLLLGLFPVGEQWTIQAEVQPRWNDDLTDLDQVIVRGSVGRHFGRRVTVWGGYAYIPRWSDDSRFDEQRAWQQLNVAWAPISRWSSSIRVRAEQRFLDEWGDSSHRLRGMGRVVRPLGASPWSLALWDEYFVNLDDTPGGPAQGFDQNRLFATLLRKLSADVTLEAGYAWQVQPSTASRGVRHGHTLFAWFTYARHRDRAPSQGLPEGVPPGDGRPRHR